MVEKKRKRKGGGCFGENKGGRDMGGFERKKEGGRQVVLREGGKVDNFERRKEGVRWWF